MDNQDIKNFASSFEAGRRVIAKKYLTFVFVTLGFLFVAALFLILDYFLFHFESVWMMVAFVISLIVAGILGYSASSIRRKFTTSLLSTVQKRVLDTLFPNRSVNDAIGLNYELLMKPGFFHKADRYIGRDYMRSSYDGIPFEKASYQLQEKQVRSDGKHTYVEYVTYAEGTMYHFTFERDFGQIVKVMEKQGLVSFGSAGLKRLETEYILFNKKFATLASDETTVFYLLTPQIQEKIMELEGTFAGHFYLCFMGNELFIAVDDSHQSIVVKILKPITEETISHINTVYGIPMVFIKLLGLDKSKFKKDAGVVIS